MPADQCSAFWISAMAWAVTACTVVAILLCTKQAPAVETCCVNSGLMSITSPISQRLKSGCLQHTFQSQLRQGSSVLSPLSRRDNVVTVCVCKKQHTFDALCRYTELDLYFDNFYQTLGCQKPIQASGCQKPINHWLKAATCQQHFPATS